MLIAIILMVAVMLIMLNFFIHLDTCEFSGSPTNIITVFLPRVHMVNYRQTCEHGCAGEEWPSNSHRRLVGIIHQRTMSSMALGSKRRWPETGLDSPLVALNSDDPC